MNARAASNTPWEFRLRAFVIFIAFGAGFFFGYLIQGLISGNVTSTFVLIGQRWGDAGINAMACVAAGLVVVAWLIRLWASSYHSPGVVMNVDVVTGTFTAAGPYRYVRNPLYLGNVLLSLGVGLLGPPMVTVLVVGLNLAFAFRLIAIEESFLRVSEGDAYAEYSKKVPRLLPRLTPASLPIDNRRPNLLDGFVTEFYMFGFAAAMVYTVWQVKRGGDTNVGWMFWVIAASAVAAQFLLRPLIGKKSP
jgi:protein-S-isoprenylcysteine O-methyltransferase Ste14